MENTRNRKKIAAGFTAVVVALLLIAGTYMWWTAKDEVANEMALDRFDVKITEQFDPNTPIFPGAEVDKLVGVTNNSNIPAVARVKLLEAIEMPVEVAGSITQWSTDMTLQDGQMIIKISDAEKNNLTGSGYVAYTGTATVPAGVTLLQREVPNGDGTGTTTEYFGYVNDNNRMVNFDPATGTFTYAYYARGAATNGVHNMTGGDIDHTYITLVMGDDLSKWKLDPATGWYYYTDAIYGNSATTSDLVKAVKFSEDLPDSYQGAKYTLTPQMEAAQFNADAIAEWDELLTGVTFTDQTTGETVTS